MSRLSQLAVSFETEDEDRPDLSALVAEIEHRLAALEDVDEVYADVDGATRRFSLRVDLWGPADCNLASTEMINAVKQLIPRLVKEPRAGEVWLLNQGED